MDENFHFTGMTGFSPAIFLSCTVLSSRMSANTILPLSTSIKHNPDNKTKSALNPTFVKITPSFFQNPPQCTLFALEILHLLSFFNAPGKTAYSQENLKTKSYAYLGGGGGEVLWSIRTDSQEGGTETRNGKRENEKWEPNVT